MALLRPIVAFLLTAVLLSAALMAQAREMVSVARPEIHLRKGPGTRYASDWTVIRGYPLAVIGRKGNWLHVRDFENDRSWVLRSLTGPRPHHIVKVKTANLRRTPSTRGRIVGRAPYGEVLLTLGHRGDWVKVRDARGTTGWVARGLVWGW